MATLNALLGLRVSPAQAQFEPRSWLRAIHAGESPVGLILLHDDPEKAEYYLWRLLIDCVRTRPDAAALMVSYVPGEGSPRAFYENLGFVPTGDIDDGEVVMRLSL